MADFSRKDFTGRKLLDADIPSGTKIVGSCFSQETPGSKIFPDNMTGVTFENCNLDNVEIPPGNTVKSCSTRRFKAQNDGHDWEVDGGGTATRILNHKVFEKFGLPEPLVAEIPDAKFERAVDWVKEMTAKKDAIGKGDIDPGDVIDVVEVIVPNEIKA